MAEVWACSQCGMQNESWRYWCQQCRATEDARKTRPPPPVLEPAPVPGGNRPRQSASPVLVVGVVFAVLAVGVGAFLVTRSSDRTTTTATTGVSSSSAARLSPESEAKLRDEQIAERLNFKARDFPDQWKADPRLKSAIAQGAAAVNRVAACGGLSDMSRPNDVIAESPNFTSGIFTAYSAVQITDDPAKVVSDFTQLTSGDFLTCIHDVIVDSLGGEELCKCLGLEVTPVEYPAPPNAPPMTYSFGLVITVHGNFLSEMDGILIGAGRTELSLLLSGTTGPFPVDFGRELIATELQRLQDNPTN